MSERIKHSTDPRAQEAQSAIGAIRSAYQHEVARTGLAGSLGVDAERSDETPDERRPYGSWLVGLIVGGVIVYLLMDSSFGSGIKAGLSELWNTLISIAIGVGILYGAWCLFWPIVRNFILMIIGWIIIAGIGIYSFLKSVGY